MGKRKAVKPQAGKRKASDPGGVGAGSWKSAKSATEKTGKKQDKSAPRTRLSNAQKMEIDFGAARPEGVTCRDSRPVRLRSPNGFQNRAKQGVHHEAGRISFD